jgi:predicted anti-sigma-YlaC factor YlaD
MTMSCESYRAAISAEVDGEDPGIEPRLVEAHLRSCSGCRQFAESASATRRRTRVQVAPEIPDLSQQVVRRTAAEDRSSAAWIARWLLALVAAQIVVLSLPDLFASGQDAHSGRHLGAFGLAYAVGLVVVVVRPARARTMFHVALVLAAAMVVTAIVDIAQGRIPLVNETVHIPELFSVLFLWILARPRPATPDAPQLDLPQSDGEDSEHEGAEVRPLRPRSNEG